MKVHSEMNSKKWKLKWKVKKWKVKSEIKKGIEKYKWKVKVIRKREKQKVKNEWEKWKWKLKFAILWHLHLQSNVHWNEGAPKHIANQSSEKLKSAEW